MLGSCFDKLVESHSSSVESSEAVVSPARKNKRQRPKLKATTATAIKAPQSRYWSAGESKDFEVALKLFKTDYSAISKYVGTRTPSQVRSHAKKFYQKLIRDYKKRNQKKKEEEREKSRGGKDSPPPTHSCDCTCHRSQDDEPSPSCSAAPALALESPTSTLLTFENCGAPPSWAATPAGATIEHGFGGSYDYSMLSQDDAGDGLFYDGGGSSFSIPAAAPESSGMGLPPLADHGGDSMESLFSFFFEEDPYYG